MILQALVEYYDRQAADPESGIAPPGWEWKALPFIIEISRAGELVQIADTRERDGNRLVARRFLVPQGPKRAYGIAANLLWDNVAYVLGIADGGGDRVVRQRHAFVDAIAERFPGTADVGILAVRKFLVAIPLERLEAQPSWPEMIASNSFISFRLAGHDELICQREIVRASLANRDWEPDGLCLVTGQRTRIARLHPPIRGVRGANTSGASLVSFNLDAFESFDHRQGANAPVGEAAAFAYTTALNDLLIKQRVSVGDASIVFWAERRDASIVVAAFASLIAEPPRDDPLAGTRAVENVLNSVRNGVPLSGDDGSRFYILALAPNAARLSVREWAVTTVTDLAGNITRHHHDLEIVRPPFIPRYPSLYRLLNATAVQSKAENVPPNLAGDVLRAILRDQPYPISLLQAALRRVRVASRDHFDPLPLLASVIKASLNRMARAGRISVEKELAVALDPDNPETAYRLGRLFALLERAQDMASPDLKATIRDRFYGAASTTPVTVFGRLLALKNHHVAKFDRPRDRAWIERQIGEVMDGLGAFPSHLSLAEQGTFAIGYYHQRQSFYAKKGEALELIAPAPAD